MAVAAPTLIGPDADGRWLHVEGARIVALGTGPLPNLPDATRLLCPEARLEAGAINAHTHLYSGLAPLGMPAPMPPPENFVQILERVWWRLDRALDEASLSASARLYVAEALLAGTTTLVDHHESPACIAGSLDVLAAACDELGIRAALTYGATERNGGTQEARRGLAECQRFVERLQHTPAARLRGLVGLHASFTVSDPAIRDAGRLCKKLGVPLHVHVAEDQADVRDAKQRGFVGPYERLRHLGALVPRSILAHGIYLSPELVRDAERLQLWLVHNPRSNRGNRVGYAKELGHSRRVALGTDGYPADMQAEAEALRAEGKAAGQNPESLAARLPAGRQLVGELFGARFELDAGAVADVVARSPTGVVHVLVDGVPRVRDGTLVGADLQAIRASAQREAARLWERMATIP